MRRSHSKSVLGYSALGFAAISLASYSLARGFRLPSNWTYTHYLFNYEFGVVKRGIIGWLYQLTAPDQVIPYHSFAIIAALIMAANLVCFTLIIIRVIERHPHTWVSLTVMLFFSSLALVYFAHTIGYADHLGLLLIQLAILLRSYRQHTYIVYLFFALLLWAHEALFVAYFPVMFIIALRTPWQNNKLLLTWSALCFFTVVIISQLVIPGESSAEMHSKAESATGTHIEQIVLKYYPGMPMRT